MFVFLFQYFCVKIKLANSTTDEYLNDEWIKNGFADPESSSDEA